MTELAAFALASLVLLATPGPTNTLLAASAASRGFAPSLPLLLGEAAGYFAAIVILRTFFGPIISAEPLFGQALSALACLYVLHLSIALWRKSTRPGEPESSIGIKTVFLTTLINPKAVVFAFTLLPAVDQEAVLLPWLLTLFILIALCGGGWIALGATLSRGDASGARVGYRVGAVALLTLAMLLGTRAAGMS